MPPARPNVAARLVLTCCEVDLEERIVRREGATTALSPKETELLLYLSEHAGRAVSRRELEREVWGFRDGVESQTVAVCVRRLTGMALLDGSRAQWG